MISFTFPPLFASWTESPFFLVAAIGSIFLILFLLVLVLFEPGLEYKLKAPASSIDSEAYLQLVGLLADAQVHPRCRIEVLTDGEQFYEAELAAIRAAQRSINLEVYIFEAGDVARRFLEALTERARAGVSVKLVLDAVGSMSAKESLFKDLRAAGGRVAWYHPLHWYNFKRLNNRTHRDILVTDGRIGFLGGAGVSDRWLLDRPDDPCWRDTMVRLEGEGVGSLQSAFAENWLESVGEILTGEDDFPPDAAAAEVGADSDTVGLVVNSAPSAGRATRARILYQVLLASARKSIHITSPYFLPDRSARQELVRAVRERGVTVKVVTAGPHNDQWLARRGSRRLYGELLESGVEMHEYQTAMMHAKVMVIDGLWSVVGSTNFDRRSFGHNDEVNLAARDRNLATRLNEDFERDLVKSHRVTLEEWRRRSLWERVQEALSWILKRQT